MTADPLGLAEDIAAATESFLASARALDDAAVSAPSRLPGWTRGHVLTHVARNADAAVNLLTWARTGVVTPQYVDAAQRVSDIEIGAPRPVADQVADLVAACAGFAEAVAAMPPAAWSQTVRWLNGAEAPAARVMWSRLREIEIHHVDLGTAYTAADWPAAFSVRLATSVAKDFAERVDGPRIVLRCPDVGHDLVIGPGVTSPIVTGPASAVVAWLIGRSAGEDLGVEPAGALPAVPPLG